MGAIADRVSGMRGCSLRQIVDEIAAMEAAPKRAKAVPVVNEDEFHLFWANFPNKVGKPVARKAFGKARQQADFKAIMDGLGRYIRDKPADRPWLNPATFLNQARYNDAPAPVIAKGVEGIRQQLRQEIENGRGRSAGAGSARLEPVRRLPQYG